MDGPLPLIGHDRDHHEHRRQRNRAWIGLAVAITVTTAAQLCWKAAANHPPVGAPGGAGAGGGLVGGLGVVFRQPLFLLAMLLYALEFFNWMWVLSNADLSYAQPIAAISNVFILFFAWALLGEHVPPPRIVGLSLILAGVFFISQTGHRTVPRRVRVPVVPRPADVPSGDGESAEEPALSPRITEQAKATVGSD
jgi:multidrug transporter EmrE-like cation transporter